MDRLTRIIEDGPISVLSVCQARVEDVAIWKEWSVSKDSSIEEALLRLAAYEDTGLTPEVCAEYRKFEDEAVASGMTFGEVVELMRAEKDGRVVVLPCKVGDMVYVTTRGYIEETEVRTLFFGHPSYSGGAPDPHYYRIRCENLDLRWDAIGKTVFLARDEAEKALGRSKDER